MNINIPEPNFNISLDQDNLAFGQRTIVISTAANFVVRETEVHIWFRFPGDNDQEKIHCKLMCKTAAKTQELVELLLTRNVAQQEPVGVNNSEATCNIDPESPDPKEDKCLRAIFLEAKTIREQELKEVLESACDELEDSEDDFKQTMQAAIRGLFGPTPQGKGNG